MGADEEEEKKEEMDKLAAMKAQLMASLNLGIKASWQAEAEATALNATVQVEDVAAEMRKGTRASADSINNSVTEGIGVKTSGFVKTIAQPVKKSVTTLAK